MLFRSGTWFSGGLGSVRLTVGLDDLKGLFQPKRFYDSKLSSNLYQHCSCQKHVGAHLSESF